MKVTAKKGGQILNSEGQMDVAAWGQPASWVDYTGPIDDEIVGIAILNHPQSFRYPTHWHVRTYGLFAANPFGLSDFYGAKKDVDGSLELKADDSFSLFYRVIFHRGTTKKAGIAEAFQRYAKIEKPE